MRRVFTLLITATVLSLLISGCGAGRSGGTTDAATPGPSVATGFEIESPTAPRGSAPSAADTAQPSATPVASADSGPETKLMQAAQDIVEILRDRDLERLAAAADPQSGIRFSPYFHIDSKTAPVFHAAKFPGFKDSGKLTWGSYDGSGEPIELTFREYFERFVYDQDFAGAPLVNLNKLTGKGNSPFNGQEIYPDASFVEFHFPGFDKKHEGMDWESLVLVFLPAGQDWKLAAIVHGSWTI
jgi:hypothetical protein